MPRCTVAIPVFNQKTFVSSAIRSALEQDVKDLQIVVVDNCSTDGTWETLQAFKNEGVSVLRNTGNIGLFGNFNRCLELAHAPFLRILCADDRLAPDCIKSEIELMERHPDAVMLSTAGRYERPDGSPLEPFATNFAPGVYEGSRFPCAWFAFYARTRINALNYPSGVLFRTRLLPSALRFREDLKTAGDIDFYFRALEHGNLLIGSELGCYVARHPGQTHISFNRDGTAILEHLDLLTSRRADIGERAYWTVRSQLGGACLLLSLRWAARKSTYRYVHRYLGLARSLAPGWFGAAAAAVRIGFSRVAAKLFGTRVPFAPHPLRPL